jgi:hypothetical protein
MTIRTISRFEFEQLLAHYTALESLMVEQVEWFSGKSGNLLGVIAKGEGVAGWNYAIFKRDRKGDFPVQKVMSNFFNLNATRVDLFLSMKTEFLDYPLEILLEIKSEPKRIP